MNSGKRWIAVSVDQASHPVVGMHRPPPKPADPKRHAVAPYVAWQMLLIDAAWQDHKTIIGNTPVKIRRGQAIGSLNYLAGKWNWTVKTVRGFLDLLIDEGMIERGTQKGRLPSLLTICNYEKYQSPDSDDRADKGHEKGTQRAQKGQHNTKDTNIPNNIINFSNSHQESAREPSSQVACIEKPVQSRVDRKQSASFFDDPYERCKINPSSGQIEITDDLRADWRATFGCDDRWLDLALIQAAGFVQRHSSTPLERRVASQIAQQARSRMESDKRYKARVELGEKERKEKAISTLRRF